MALKSNIFAKNIAPHATRNGYRITWCRILAYPGCKNIEIREIGVNSIFSSNAEILDQDYLNVGIIDLSQLGKLIDEIKKEIGEDTYESEAELNNDLTSFDVNFNRNVSERLDLGIRVFVAKRDFKTANQTADDKSLTVSFERSIGRRFSLTGEYRLTSRDGKGVREYSENTVVASLRYGLRSDD